jgi:hypothetical protein
MRQRAAPERGERVSTAEDRTWSMSALFIASRRVEHDRSDRLLCP